MNKTYMEQHKCRYCNNSAEHYLMYKEFYGFICKNKECDLKFRIMNGIFKTGIEVNGGK